MTEQNIEITTLANGCFWCTEAVFQRLKGVQEVTSGFIGGQKENPLYLEVVQGNTGYAEAIQIKFDPNIISYAELLQVFFATHDPTSLNRQGNDAGTQYRSVIFYHSEKQRLIAEQVLKEMNTSHFEGKIVTEITRASTFYSAESVHQNFYQTHRQNPYCEIVIDPKIKKLQALFADKLID